MLLLLFSVMLASLTGLSYLNHRERVRRDRKKITVVMAGGWLAAELPTKDDE